MSKHLSPAYQLYSAREDASNDLEGVLDQLSRMGYEGVEFAGFFEKTAKEVRKLLKHTGLKTFCIVICANASSGISRSAAIFSAT